MKFLKRMIAASKRHQKQHSIHYKFGLRIPCDYKDALLIDKSNDNTHWQNAIQLELDNIHAHRTFRDLGPGTPIPSGYHNIRVHFVFDVKEDGRRKARLVAGGPSLLFVMNLSIPVLLPFTAYALQSSLVN